MPVATTDPCPCGGPTYAECCRPLHDGSRAAVTASELMRSRYSAYAVGHSGYLFRTWHPRTRPPEISTDGLVWTGLRIIDIVDGAEVDEAGVVEFCADFLDGDQTAQLHERSRFVKRRGRWVYVEAESLSTVR